MRRNTAEWLQVVNDTLDDLKAGKIDSNHSGDVCNLVGKAIGMKKLEIELSRLIKVGEKGKVVVKTREV